MANFTPIVGNTPCPECKEIFKHGDIIVSIDPLPRAIVTYKRSHALIHKACVQATDIVWGDPAGRALF